MDSITICPPTELFSFNENEYSDASPTDFSKFHCFELSQTPIGAILLFNRKFAVEVFLNCVGLTAIESLFFTALTYRQVPSAANNTCSPVSVTAWFGPVQYSR